MNPILTRRRILQLAALAPFAGAVAARAAAPVAPKTRAHFAPALNVYSFNDALLANAKDSGKGIDLFGIFDFCAQHDIPAIDITGYFFPGYPQAPTDAFINRVKRRTHDLGIVISGTGVRNDFAIADAAVRAEGVAITKRWIEVAVKLGAPTVRVFAGPQTKGNDWRTAAPGMKREDVEAWMADALRECADFGAKHGVIVAVQNHGDFLSTGPEHLSLLRRVNHPWCGAMVDTGKYLTADPYADIALMVPHAVNWQIKETLGSTLKSPRADFSKLARVLRDGGCRGFVPIETLTMGRADYDAAAEVVKVLGAMRTAIAELG
jgi:sugar phosphate isomerase/epimerase